MHWANREPYAFPICHRFTGPANAPILPGPDGHFDHFEVGTRGFNAAHMYGTLRFVLDIWESYFERKVEWHFSKHFARLDSFPISIGITRNRATASSRLVTVLTRTMASIRFA